ncbi:uncharacterized protein LOC118764541 [Octopus sinensis]|uniref:Uncharacterized protein LOC118764541 n=1 Tax=Octopus sinensis TaxID=2607531 RepID=A0A7E6F2U4_9MOLL|nr:uncharacterized protein LOC118764541 [Octopus sinensis]
MLADPVETVGHLSFTTRPKRLRICGDGSTYNHRHNDVSGSGCKTLELQGVIDLLKQYDDYEGGVNCSICGKLYKSKVCFIKHIWEHSIYWDLFEGEKNHDRVLSIQAAIILYSKYQGEPTADGLLSHLLVTAPNSHEKKREKESLEQCEMKASKAKTEKRTLSPLKRKKSFEDL